MTETPERTPDGRYLVIDGRRWRASDPTIPEERRSELTHVLMAWRREGAARAGVNAAKIALGERGAPWWEQSDDERRARWSVGLPVPHEST